MHLGVPLFFTHRKERDLSSKKVRGGVGGTPLPPFWDGRAPGIPRCLLSARRMMVGNRVGGGPWLEKNGGGVGGTHPPFILRIPLWGPARAYPFPAG